MLKLVVTTFKYLVVYIKSFEVLISSAALLWVSVCLYVYYHQTNWTTITLLSRINYKKGLCKPLFKNWSILNIINHSAYNKSLYLFVHNIKNISTNSYYILGVKHTKDTSNYLLFAIQNISFSFITKKPSNDPVSIQLSTG